MGYFDRWGNWQGDINSAPGRTVPYIVSEEGNIIYVCYQNTPLRAIRRITKVQTGGVKTTTVEIARGAWEDRATLNYVPVNEPIPEDE
jgi:hypothetical protein